LKDRDITTVKIACVETSIGIYPSMAL
jgi:hypothetical protein